MKPSFKTHSHSVASKERKKEKNETFAIFLLWNAQRTPNTHSHAHRSDNDDNNMKPRQVLCIFHSHDDVSFCFLSFSCDTYRLVPQVILPRRIHIQLPWASPPCSTFHMLALYRAQQLRLCHRVVGQLVLRQPLLFPVQLAWEGVLVQVPSPPPLRVIQVCLSLRPVLVSTVCHPWLVQRQRPKKV